MTSKLQHGARLESQARQALCQYHLPVPSKLELLTFSENAVFRAHFRDHESVVVRLHSLGYHGNAEIESELMWVEALQAQTDIRVPSVLRTPTGDGVVVATHPEFPPRFAAVLGDLPGESPTDENIVSDFRILGRTTASLHNHAQRWTPPAAFQRFSWDLNGTFGVNANWGRWQQGPNVDEPLVAVLTSAERLIRRRLQDYGQAPHRFGLIHSDLRLANILMNGDIAQVIDFDDCGFGWFFYDLASALTFIEDDPKVPELITAWLEGYGEIRPLDSADVAEIPTLIMLRRMVILAWLGSRPGTSIVRDEGARYARVTGEMAESYLSSLAEDASSHTGLG